MFNTRLVTTSIKDHIVKGLTDLWWKAMSAESWKLLVCTWQDCFLSCGLVFVWRSCNLYPSYTATFCNKGMQSHSSWCLCPVHVRFCHGFGLDPATEKLCWLAWHHPQAPYAPGKTWKVPLASPFFGRFWHAATPFQGLATGGEPSRGSFFLCYLTGFPVSFILIYNIFIICNHHFFRGSKANEI